MLRAVLGRRTTTTSKNRNANHALTSTTTTKENVVGLAITKIPPTTTSTPMEQEVPPPPRPMVVEQRQEEVEDRQDDQQRDLLDQVCGNIEGVVCGDDAEEETREARDADLIIDPTQRRIASTTKKLQEQQPDTTFGSMKAGASSGAKGASKVVEVPSPNVQGLRRNNSLLDEEEEEEAKEDQPKSPQEPTKSKTSKHNHPKEDGLDVVFGTVESFTCADDIQDDVLYDSSHNPEAVKHALEEADKHSGCDSCMAIVAFLDGEEETPEDDPIEATRSIHENNDHDDKSASKMLQQTVAVTNQTSTVSISSMSAGSSSTDDDGESMSSQVDKYSKHGGRTKKVSFAPNLSGETKQQKKKKSWNPLRRLFRKKSATTKATV